MGIVNAQIKAKSIGNQMVLRAFAPEINTSMARLN